MSFKRILVHADEHEGLRRASIARALAEQFRADLVSLIAAAMPIEPLGAAPNEAIVKKQEEVRRAIEKTRASVAAAATAPVHVVATRPDRMRVDTASVMRSADLIVVGPPARHGMLEADDIFHAALFMSGRPCLILPHETSRADFGNRILIAWKDSREAARALHDAAPFLERASAICLAAFKPHEDPDFLGQAALERIESTLRARGLPVESVVVRPDRGGAHVALFREVAEFNADMTVMGGYGRSRISEFLFGGMTRGVLEKMDLPVFMSH